MFVLMWIFTPTVFWPMSRELYGVGRGRIVESDAQVLRVVRRWIIFDCLDGGHRGGVFVVGSSDQRSFSWCAGEPQQLGVRYGREYARTTGRRDGFGTGGR